MNYIKNVANMLGVEIGQTFTIKGFDDTTYEFTNECLLVNRKNYTSKDYYALGNLLSGVYEIDKTITLKPTLTENERVYLYCLIQPYESAVITKKCRNGYEYINVEYNEDNTNKTIYTPSFKPSTMFTGLQLNKDYTTSDLGL